MRKIILVAASLVLTGCGSTPAPPPPPTSPAVPPPAVDTSASSSATLAARPLRFPVVAAGSECPITPSRVWTGPGQAGAVLGDGPVYPVADYFAGGDQRSSVAGGDQRSSVAGGDQRNSPGGDRGPGMTLELRAEDREPDGSYTKKVRWIAEGYTGPVLIRAARVDAAGTASVKFLYWGRASDGGYYAELPRTSNDLPATTKVSGPGCFAYQVDGSDFTTMIVFRAAPE
jgi:hypothetical protein